MGTWSHNPLDNDEAQDLLGDFNDVGDVSILEKALDTVCNLKDDEYLEAPQAQQAIAATKIIHNLNDDQIKPEEKNRLLQKADKGLERILKDSELRELWAESPEYNEWVESVRSLISHMS